MDAAVSEHVTFVSGLTYVNVLAARIDAPAAAKLEVPGTLWISGHHLFVRHAINVDQITQLDHQNIGGGTVVTKILMNDGKWTDVVNQYFLWCPQSQTPDLSGNQCLKARMLVGEEGSVQSRAHRAQWQPMGFNGLLERQLTVFTGSAADQQLARFGAVEATNEKAAKMYDAARAEQAIEKQHADEARQERMRTASVGTKDFCTSRFLIARDRPVDSDLFLTCGMYGQVTVGQLRDAHWDIQVTGRIPEQGTLGATGDSIEITAVKLR